MSHFTKVKTQIMDTEALEAALEALGYPCEVGDDITLRGYYDNDRLADIVIRKADLPGRLGTYSDLGFAKGDDGTYELIVDDYFPKEVEAFTQQVNQRYALEVVVKNAQWQGYSVEAQETEADGTVRLTMVKW